VDNENVNNENSNSDKTEHPAYEIKMFYRLAKGLSQDKNFELSKDILEDYIVKNALLESFLLHTRIIIEFLSKKKSHTNDINYEDFLPNRKEPFICDFDSKSMKDRINKEIIHLTKNRYEDEKSKWSVQDIVCCLIKYLSQFLDEVESTKVDFDEKYKKEIKDEIDDLEKSFCENNSNEKYPQFTTTASTSGTFSIPYVPPN